MTVVFPLSVFLPTVAKNFTPLKKQNSKGKTYFTEKKSKVLIFFRDVIITARNYLKTLFKIIIHISF